MNLLESNGRNDCVVRAIRDATGIPYERVAEVLCRISPRHTPGKPVRSGFMPHEYEAALKELGVAFEERSLWDSCREQRGMVNKHYRPTLAQWLRAEAIHHRHPCLVSSTGHLFAASKGRLNDHTGRRKRISRVYVLVDLTPIDLEGLHAEKAGRTGPRTLGERVDTERLHRWVAAAIGVWGIDYKESRGGEVTGLNCSPALRRFRSEGLSCSWKRFYEAYEIEAIKDGYDPDRYDF